MKHFNAEFLKFFKGLSRNNSSEWFNENRKTYESEVKKPFALFVEDMIKRIREHEPAVKIKPADAITRINKDIRFSKDKIPYNTYVGAIISPYGRKSKEYPGLYIQLGADKISLFGGAYMLEKDNLQKVRTYISKNLSEFEKLISAKAFVSKFGSIQGEKNKVLAPEFKDLLSKQPLIANKSFYFSADIDARHITSEELSDLIMAYYLAGKPVNDFLIRAMGK